ncbi:MAG TPA: hypothetical protein VD905_15870 [Flavobacteriales bacterium]|nr:hypothetical protein [Flavobacteriales bacterium]
MLWFGEEGSNYSQKIKLDQDPTKEKRKEIVTTQQSTVKTLWNRSYLYQTPPSELVWSQGTRKHKLARVFCTTVYDDGHHGRSGKKYKPTETTPSNTKKQRQKEQKATETTKGTKKASANTAGHCNVSGMH